MRRIGRSLASPATVIAILALTIAVGGTSYAVTKPPKNSVGTAQLKNHAVTTKKLASAASARVARLTYRTAPVTAPAGSGGVLTVPCPNGLTAISGGVETPHDLSAFLLDSHPVSNGWEVSVANTAGAPELITAYAVCAKVEGGAATMAKVQGSKANIRWSKLAR